MRNVLLIIRREYLEKVRTKGFVISTIAMPLITALFLLPSLATMTSKSATRIVVATTDQILAEQVKERLEKRDDPNSARYTVEVVSELTDHQREQLRERIVRKQIDGYLWVGEQELASHHVPYVCRQTGDFIQQNTLRSALQSAVLAQSLSKRGATKAEVADLLKDIDLDAKRVEAGKESQVDTRVSFLAYFSLVMLLYVVVLLYGVAVMRSVVEEKTSRVMEVILSCVTPRQLLTGKVFGVAAVGLTQILIWLLITMFTSLQGALFGNFLQKIHLSALALITFPVFFLFGYLLYATMYAALGAAVSTEQEGQQMQFVIMLPLIVCMAMMVSVIQHPNDSFAVIASMIPLVSPLIMYLRIAVEPPPLWQVLLSIGLLVGTVYGLLIVCSRIYRVGILMYGKRATLPEILKWLKYADV